MSVPFFVLSHAFASHIVVSTLRSDSGNWPSTCNPRSSSRCYLNCSRKLTVHKAFNRNKEFKKGLFRVKSCICVWPLQPLGTILIWVLDLRRIFTFICRALYTFEINIFLMSVVFIYLISWYWITKKYKW